MLLISAPNKWCPLCACYLPETPAFWNWVRNTARETLRSSGYCRKCDSLRTKARKWPDRYVRPTYTPPPSENQLGMLLCSKCDVYKWYTEFKGAKEGKRPKNLICRWCNRIEAVKYRRKYPARAKQAKADWWANNPNARRMYEHIRRARKVKADWVPPSKTDLIGILQYQKYRCLYCNCELSRSTVTVDHVLPLSRGGSHSAENLAASCLSCNSSKSDKTLEEFVRWRCDVLGVAPVCEVPGEYESAKARETV